ncbi:hypothetical protein [Nocardia aurea]|uniref:Transposase n=1 Tax=Nocardia aurea TaxID=2144174 RepID=A0ABV3FSP6_9NOCA
MEAEIKGGPMAASVTRLRTPRSAAEAFLDTIGPAKDLDLAGRCAPVKSKGAKPRTRRRGAAHHEHILEKVYRDAGSARLLPRLIRGRTRGPVFLTHRLPGPGKYLAERDICPTPAARDCPTTRLAIYSTPPPRSTGPKQAGICTNSGIPVSHTSGNPEPTCSSR